jgi:predicted nucleotidyltransferase
MAPVAPSPELPARVLRALDSFVAPWMVRKGVVGVLLCGSAARGRFDRNSDLDVHIVLDRAARRTRGNVRVNGVEVEYFLNPVAQIRAYLRDEKERHTAHMFATGVVLRDSPAMRRLVARARAVLRSAWPRPTRTRRELDRYVLDDHRKDLEDLLARGDLVGHSVETGRILELCVGVLFAHRRARPEKVKDLVAGVRTLDATFARRMARVALATGPRERHRAARELIRAAERLLGGRRPSTWRLSGPLVGVAR